jgi:hypothetical protein
LFLAGCSTAYVSTVKRRLERPAAAVTGPASSAAAAFAGQAAVDLLFQEPDFLFSIGLLDSGAAERREQSQRRPDARRASGLERPGASLSRTGCSGKA